MLRKCTAANVAGVLLLLFVSVVAWNRQPIQAQPGSGAPLVIELPKPSLDGTISVEAAITKRRSVREFAPTALTLAQVGQLAWAAQGITDAGTGYRAAPSAGSLYPLELYFLTAQGVFHYLPTGHRMERLSDADPRPKLAEAGWRQKQIAEAPLVIVMAAALERTVAKFGDRASRYVHIEAGHVGQNIQLQAVALGLASVPLGASDDPKVRAVLGVPEGQEVVYVVCLGEPRGK